jgi:hypothetical protein
MQTFLAQQCFQSGRAAFIGAGWAPTFLVGVARQMSADVGQASATSADISP